MPLYVPVYIKTFLTVFTNSYPSSKNVSAMYFALKGSPGIKTNLAIDPFGAFMCGVIFSP
nr:hypothetical protein [Mycoplasmopsis bovis]